jgi:hypothetical protein
MLSDEDKNFIMYWEKNRSRKKSLLWKLAAGLPLGVIMAAAIFINFFTGISVWFKRAAMELNVNSSGVIVILIALLMIVVFVAIFTARHKWEMNEQRYRELISRNKNNT